MKIPDEAFSESDGQGSVRCQAGYTRYHYDDSNVVVTDWPGFEFAELADVGRALKKRHPGKTIVVPPFVASGDTDPDLFANEEKFNGLIREALRALGVSQADIEGIKAYEGSPGGDYRKTLRNATFYGERYLVGKSLMQHHDPFHEVGTNGKMDYLAEELAETARAVIFSTQDGGDRPKTLRLVVRQLRRAIDDAVRSQG